MSLKIFKTNKVEQIIQKLFTTKYTWLRKQHPRRKINMTAKEIKSLIIFLGSIGENFSVLYGLSLEERSTIIHHIVHEIWIFLKLGPHYLCRTNNDDAEENHPKITLVSTQMFKKAHFFTMIILKNDFTILCETIYICIYME